MKLAPIGVSTYSRRDHLANNLRALAANELAKESELFIFSDAPRPGDEKAVAEVRSLIKNVPGFKNVHVIERTTNDRVANNREGIKFLLREFGHMIYLEEDIVTAPAFLSFMNEGLQEFKENKRVFGICGYTPPAGLERITNRDVFCCRRFSAWGFGTWADRYSQIEMDRIDIGSLSPLQRWRLRSAGMDLVRFVDRMTRGELEALDVRINITLAKHGLKVVCPTTSLTVNRGHDGSGIHCGTTDYFETPLDERTGVDWQFDRAKADWRIDKALYFYRGRHKWSPQSSIRYHVTRNLKFGT